MCEPARDVVGVMTGTSIDGIDAALARVHGQGLWMRAELVRQVSRPLGELREPLRRAAAQEPMSAGTLARLARAFGELHVEVIEELLDERLSDEETKRRSGERQAGSPDLISVHGQTVFHAPPVSWQLMDVSPMAQRFRCPVVRDLRAADLCAGGQGAPITPMADWVLFRDAHASRAIVNLGGFCNVTVLGKRRSDEETERRSAVELREELRAVRGFDVCACNQVLDAVAREALDAPFDEDGAAARRGRINARAAAQLRDVLRGQNTAQRSLGTGDEALRWVCQWSPAVAGDDLAATAVWAVAQCIGEVLTELNVDEVYLAGGGARHRLLVELLDQRCAAPVRLLDELGVPIDAREALAMAVLGALCADGVPITLPAVTGCNDPAPVAGSWCLPGGLAVSDQCAGADAVVVER